MWSMADAARFAGQAVGHARAGGDLADAAILLGSAAACHRPLILGRRECPAVLFAGHSLSVLTII